MNKKLEIILVVPSGAWTNWESAHLRGSPATHGVLWNSDGKTLCGRDCEGWIPIVFRIEHAELNCKRCKASKAYRAMLKEAQL